MLVADRRVALVPLTLTLKASGCSTMLLDDADLIAEFVESFRRLWEASEPRRDPVNNDRKFAILAHLALGHTDSAIAAALKVGERTIRREVNALMTGTGARSRFQLGMHTVALDLLHRRKGRAPISDMSF